MLSMLLTDGYKLGHHLMYPKGMTRLYSNLTPRSNRHMPEADRGMVVFGIQYFIKKYLIEDFNKNFFDLPKDQVLKEYKELLVNFLGQETADMIGTDHIAALHDLGYLPIKIKALPEGSYCPIGVPVLTITNTHPDFAWLTNYLETLISTELWHPMTAATIADTFKRQLITHAKKTGFEDQDLGFLCHDFSMRGMCGVEAAGISSLAFLTSFTGCETVPAIILAQKYYNGKGLIGGTIPATEHSVECTNANLDQKVDDEAYLDHILDTFPTGFISIVADGYDYWKFIKAIGRRKDRIMARNGRIVVRPDSGDPVKIICGDPESDDPIVRMGSYEYLHAIFGGGLTNKGYKTLDSHIGLIYGDSITINRQKKIYEQLEAKGFAATNLCLGVGSYSMQSNTRDSLGLAVKSTYCEVDGKSIEIFKDPKTVVGMPKKSLKGLIKVDWDVDHFVVKDQVSNEQEEEGCLYRVFEDGSLYHTTDLEEIRLMRKAALTYDN